MSLRSATKPQCRVVYLAPCHTQFRVPPTPSYRRIIDHAVAQVFAVTRVELSRQSRGPAHVALARQVAMYLAHVSCGLSFTQIGTLFDRDRTTVAHACAVVEDRRDERMFDAVLEILECAVVSMVGHRRVPPLAHKKKES